MSGRIPRIGRGRKQARRVGGKRHWRQWSDSLGRPGFGRRRRGRGAGRARSRRRASRTARLLRRSLAVAIVVFGVLTWQLPELVRPPAFLSSEPQRIDARWAACRGRASASPGPCVVDGDTIRIGGEAVRLLGFDTPETDARCEREAALAQAATARLTDWLNEGPVWVQARRDDPTDRWGRPLRELYRGAGTARVYASDMLVEAGLARRYYGWAREGWCEPD